MLEDQLKLVDDEYGTLESSQKVEGENALNETCKSDLMKTRIMQMKKAIDSYREYKSEISFSLHSQYSMDEVVLSEDPNEKTPMSASH